MKRKRMRLLIVVFAAAFAVLFCLTLLLPMFR
jgi:hypothetical protein